MQQNCLETLSRPPSRLPIPLAYSSALEVIFYNEMRYINLRFTYLLTYLLSLDALGFSIWAPSAVCTTLCQKIPATPLFLDFKHLRKTQKLRRLLNCHLCMNHTVCVLYIVSFCFYSVVFSVFSRSYCYTV